MRKTICVIAIALLFGGALCIRRQPDSAEKMVNTQSPTTSKQGEASSNPQLTEASTSQVGALAKVVETHEKVIHYTVCIPVHETHTKQVNYTVMRPVKETLEKEISYTVLKQVTEDRVASDSNGAQDRIIRTVKYVPEPKVKTVSYTVTKMVPENCTKTVEYKTCRMVNENRQKTVQYTTTRFVPIAELQEKAK